MGYRFPFSDFIPVESEKASYDAQKAVHTALEQIAPAFGYGYGDDTLPIFEYYIHNPQTHKPETAYLYVPVSKCS